MRFTDHIRALSGVNRRLYLHSIPRRLKCLWLRMTLRVPHQCQACLDWFTAGQVILTPSPYCPHKFDCPQKHNRRGACKGFICRGCRKNGYDGVNDGPSCYCDC